MSGVESKNIYALLGNTSDQDSDREPEPPTKAVDKTAARSGKRDAPKSAPSAPVAETNAPRGGGNRRGGGFTGNEAAFRDRTTGRNSNRDKPVDDQPEQINRPGRDSGPGVRRGGRGQRGPRRGGDRHSRTGISEHQKQTDQAWGGATGEGEWADEKAGEAIANQEVKEGGFDANPEAPVNADGKTLEEKEEEPEDTHKSYADYLIEQATKKAAGLGLLEARAANEGAKANKKWDAAKELSRADEEAYFAGEAKAARQRERTQNKKNVLDVDYSFKEQPRETRGRGGRGGPGRGGRGRGDFSDRGDRGDRGGRGGRGRGGRGRGGADGATVALDDSSAFPSLGA